MRIYKVCLFTQNDKRPLGGMREMERIKQVIYVCMNALVMLDVTHNFRLCSFRQEHKHTHIFWEAFFPQNKKQCSHTVVKGKVKF
mmetsp:Transcript_12972/g.15843  ORF Transcript_12972/g.15843 Transcript_12972/m.15843 type:complete len:85 (-) Transcript_12972:34-288(-)